MCFLKVHNQNDITVWTPENYSIRAEQHPDILAAFLPTLSFPLFETSKEKSIQSTKMYNTVTFYQLIATACPESLR